MDKYETEWAKLSTMSLEELTRLRGRSRIGCHLVDHYFLDERLKVESKGVSFRTFMRDIEEFKKKKYVQTLIQFCHKNNRYKDSPEKMYYYIYGLAYKRANPFKVSNALIVYRRYKPTRVLDPFCGFGGKLIAALMLGIPYVGVDINHDLKPGYDRLLARHPGEVQLLFEDSLTVDYGKIEYDMVFASPPYYNIEIYPNNPRRSVLEWGAFYDKIFPLLWKHLKPGGTFALNVSPKIYAAHLVPLLGASLSADPLSKSTRNDTYTEFVYVWVKP